jgi:dienelactone hydrolase
MAEVLLIHSVLGLREFEHEAAERLRAGGHAVAVPDLFEGVRPATIDDGIALVEEAGFATFAARAERAAAPLPPSTVLAGFSFGTAVAAHLWAGRPETAGVLLLHGLADIPASARPGTPAQLHLAEPDPYEDEAFVPEVAEAAARVGVPLEIHRYPGAGHLFTDPTLDGHDAAATDLLWQRVGKFLDRL